MCVVSQSLIALNVEVKVAEFRCFIICLVNGISLQAYLRSENIRCKEIQQYIKSDSQLLGLAQTFEKTHGVLSLPREYGTSVCVLPKQLCLYPRRVEGAHEDVLSILLSWKFLSGWRNTFCLQLRVSTATQGSLGIGSDKQENVII